jgi:hypothetical protein
MDVAVNIVEEEELQSRPPSKPVIEVQSQLDMHGFWLSFRDREDELLFLRERIEAAPYFIIAVATLSIAIAFASGGDSFKTGWAMLVFIVGRLLPLVAMLVFALSSLPKRANWWPHISGLCLTSAAGSLSLLSHLCASSASESALADLWSCDSVAASIMPWLPPALAIAQPFTASMLRVPWWSAAGYSAVTVALYGALVLPHLKSDELASGVAVPVLLLLLSTVALFVADRDVRVAFRATVAAQREVQSLVNRSVSGVVQQQLGARLTYIMKFAPFMITEVNGDGIVQYASPSLSVVTGACWRASGRRQCVSSVSVLPVYRHCCAPPFGSGVCSLSLGACPRAPSIAASSVTALLRCSSSPS